MMQWKNLCSPAVKYVLMPWAILFVILNLINTQDGGPNAVSRFLTLRAMSEEGTFTIDKRIGASDDWSHTPDGHYYSNKAPGPMLLGFPTFFVIDQIPRLWEKGYRDEHGHRHTPGYFQKTWTSFLNQILPLLLLMALIVNWLSRLGLQRNTLVFFVLSAFFGSTVSLFFNNYFGHGFEAILQLAALFSLLQGNFLASGFFAGAALLSDYSFVMQLPAYIIALGLVMHREQSYRRPIQSLLLGGLVPGILWIWYHTAAFGSPFTVANHFQNPIFLDTLQEEKNFLGIFRMPNVPVLWELLIGQSRGLLFTQPWILLLFPLFLIYFFPRKKGAGSSEPLDFYRKVCGLFCGLSLVGLLIVNMSYGGWQGGGTAGPRYLSGIFLCFSLWAALEIHRAPNWLRNVFFLLLAISIVFRGLVYGSTILGPGLPLWQWYWEEFFRTSKTPLLRSSIFAILFLATLWWQKKLWQKHPASANETA